MTDERLDDLLREAKTSYRIPPAADFDAIWSKVERDAFDAPLPAQVIRPARQRWLRPAIGIAATLLVGFGLGRVSRAPASPQVAAGPPADSAARTVVIADPVRGATYDYIARTVALLDSVSNPARAGGLRGDERFVSDAAQLLGTTRILLDSPAASDARLRALLEDLELVLAQVARLRTAPRADELTFIAEAVSERDMVPRLRTVAASISAEGY